MADDRSAAVCVSNIGERGARRRRRTGIVALVAGIIAALGFLATDAPPAWGVWLFIPFWIAASGFLQAREKT